MQPFLCKPAGVYNPYKSLPHEPVYFYFLGSNSSFTISGTCNIGTNTSFLSNDYEVLWVQNGTRLSLNNERSRYNASLSLEREELHLTLEILDFTDSDAGLYIGVVNTRPATLFSRFDCDRYKDNGRHQQIPVGLLLIFVQNIGQNVIVK